MKLLSILISLAMMLSGGYMAEDPNAAASTVVTIRDAVVTVDGEQYPLSPEIVLSAASENGSALIDVGMPLGEDVLFPVQVKIDESGLGMLLGQSTTLYTLTSEFFDSLLEGEDIPDEAIAMLESYGKLLGAMSSIDQTASLEQSQALGEKFMELIGDAPAEEATFHANDQDQTGQRVVFSLTSEQLSEYMDYAFSLMPAGFAEAYYGYLNATLSMAGMPEVDSYSDILAMSGMEMSIDGDMTYNETSSVAELVYHMTVDPDAATLGTEIAATEDSEIADTIEVTAAEPVTFDIPMEITVHTPENVEYTMDMDMEGVQMVMNGNLVAGAQTVTMELTAEDEVAMTMNVNTQPVDDAMQVSFVMNMEVDGVAVVLGVDNAPTDNGSTTECDFNISEESAAYGVSFAVDVTHDTFADRTEGATVAAINSLEELESNSGLMMAGMSLMGDAEKLMNDESVMALVGLLTAAYEEEISVEIAENTDEETTAAVTSAEIVMPEFGWLPEGYELTETTVQPDSTYVSFCLEKDLGDGYSSIIYVDADYYDYEKPDTTLYAIADGSAQQIDGTLLTIERIEDSLLAYTTIGSTDIWLNYFNDDANLTEEDIIRIIANITIPEAAE